MAAQVIAAAVDLGLAVPGEVSVVGFDDSPLATTVRPGLTTIHQDAFAKGLAAARELKRAIEETQPGDTYIPAHSVLPVHLVVRASTARPADPDVT